MANYTTLDQDTIDRLLAHYNIGDVEKHSSLAGGSANSSIVLTTSSGHYVLSVCDEKDIDEISTLTATLDLLSRHSFPTTKLVRTTDGRPFIEYQGKPVYIKHFIDGEVKEPLRTKMIFQVGSALARLHSIPPTDFLPVSFSYGIECFPEVYGRNDEYSKWLQQRTDDLQDCCRKELPSGLIHGDLFYDNILFRGETLTALLDFEEVCNYFFVFDLGMCAAGCCCPAGKFSLQSVSGLIDGYQSIRPLTDMEKELFQCHIEYGAVATSFWRYRQFNIVMPTPEKAEAHLQMKDLAQMVQAIPKNEFYQAVFG
ncbi:homoserine kinase [Desulfopila sp. IMCC35008]|uniref:homoserine kinase n=1 Tax=Desulfopila sp. IMCC35008 TaxID=2653858 RepID=UPI0013D33F92|nr:homoserine kinase [Desulfopila sp. IMCC35008]